MLKENSRLPLLITELPVLKMPNGVASKPVFQFQFAVAPNVDQTVLLVLDPSTAGISLSFDEKAAFEAAVAALNAIAGFEGVVGIWDASNEFALLQVPMQADWNANAVSTILGQEPVFFMGQPMGIMAGIGTDYYVESDRPFLPLGSTAFAEIPGGIDGERYSGSGAFGESGGLWIQNAVNNGFGFPWPKDSAFYSRLFGMSVMKHSENGGLTPVSVDLGISDLVYVESKFLLPAGQHKVVPCSASTSWAEYRHSILVVKFLDR